MTLTFQILGLELARLQLDIVRTQTPEPAKPVTVLDRGIKAMSGFWVKRMMSG